MVEDRPDLPSDVGNREPTSTTPPEPSAVKSGTGWVGLVANANSGIGLGKERVSRLVRTLNDRGLDSKVCWSLADRRELVDRAEADPNCRCLVAVGGDGTISALINEHPNVPITAMPAGTENLFARHFRLGRRPEPIAEMIARGRSIPLDLGEANSQRFALMAGIGFDAEVVTRHHLARIGHARRVRPTTRVAYVEPVLRASFSYGFPTLKVRIEEPGLPEELLGSTAFVFNLPSYALGLPIAPDAREDDGLLDLVVFRDSGPLAALHYLWLVFRGIHLDQPGVWHRRVKRVSITSDSPVPVQLDGDPAGSIDPSAATPWTAQVIPHAISVLVPDRYSRSMLAS